MNHLHCLRTDTELAEEEEAEEEDVEQYADRQNVCLGRTGQREKKQKHIKKKCCSSNVNAKTTQGKIK